MMAEDVTGRSEQMLGLQVIWRHQMDLILRESLFLCIDGDRCSKR